MFWIALLLGVVEGLTEFLPISSTGHLIVVSELVSFRGRRAELFQIFIQLGAILAVVWEFRGRLSRLALQVHRSRESQAFAVNIALAFVPSAILGLLIHDFVLEYLFFPSSVAGALIAGALVILAVEARRPETRTHGTDAISRRQALWIGVSQCMALCWPGFSRSAATIMGGMLVGLDRRTATAFSFYLAIPTMFAATIYSLLKSYQWLEPGDATWLALSFVVSFVVAWVSIRWLLGYVANHSFRVFAWYRLAVGIVILLVVNKH